MAKATSTNAKDATTNASNSSNPKENIKPASDNPSKYEPTKEALLDVVNLDPEDGLHQLFVDCIKDLYWAENHLVKALPKMIQAASLPSLQNALESHLAETTVHVERLEEIFNLLGEKPQAKKCDAMEGLTKEGEGTVESTDPGTPARNQGIIMSAQKVEHYEISSYTGLAALAKKLGRKDVAAVLESTLQEEKASDDKLADIATNDVTVNGKK
ncbi:MAG: ferritin-like domain-containing protein [Chitinophagaceae bacterium]|nr:MAG: ferritin-like domain-containing protein [Chitinophagaceae bacterium]